MSGSITYSDVHNKVLIPDIIDDNKSLREISNQPRDLFYEEMNVLRNDCCVREELRLPTLVLVRTESREFEFGGGE